MLDYNHEPEGTILKKTMIKRIALILALVLISTFILTACDSESRIRHRYTFSPGAQFSTNFNDEDPRRQVRCLIIFEVIDENAIDELTDNNFIVRNAVLSVLGTLTMEELTTGRNLENIAGRIVQQVNADLDSPIDLVVAAFFTEFAIA
jgi:flagellar basal body-associated protein FliL